MVLIYADMSRLADREDFGLGELGCQVRWLVERVDDKPQMQDAAAFEEQLLRFQREADARAAESKGSVEGER